jgi:hypothetical protein
MWGFPAVFGESITTCLRALSCFLTSFYICAQRRQEQLHSLIEQCGPLAHGAVKTAGKAAH